MSSFLLKQTGAKKVLYLKRFTCFEKVKKIRNLLLVERIHFGRCHFFSLVFFFLNMSCEQCEFSQETIIILEKYNERTSVKVAQLDGQQFY